MDARMTEPQDSAFPAQAKATVSTPPQFQQTVAYIDWVLGDDSKPVVRIFGSTPSGQKSLLHMHDCYPYLYCDIPAQIPAEEFVLELKHRIELSLKGDRQRGRSRVFRTSLEPNKTPIYGYAEAIDVCKVELFDPGDVRRACEFLASENIRVYNANVGYLLQVMVDLDLAGMDMITCCKYCFRGPLPSDTCTSSRASKFRSATLFDPAIIWWTDSLGLPKDYVVEVPRYAIVYDTWHAHAAMPAKTSTCELELDVSVADVVSKRVEPPAGSLAHKRIKFVKSLASWWIAEEARRKAENDSDGNNSAESKREQVIVGDDNDDDDEESNHIDSSEAYVEDPFHFRRRLSRLAKRMADQANRMDTPKSATPASFRRDQTPKDLFKNLSAFRFPDLHKEVDSQSSFSQETKEAVGIIEGWQQGRDFVETAGNAEAVDFVSEKSPSQMTDDELLNSQDETLLVDSTKTNKTVRFAPHPKKIRSFEFDEYDDIDGADNHEEEEEDDDDDDHNIWGSILASQKDFVEDVDDQMDGGVFDSEWDAVGASIDVEERLVGSVPENEVMPVEHIGFGNTIELHDQLDGGVFDDNVGNEQGKDDEDLKGDQQEGFHTPPSAIDPTTKSLLQTPNSSTRATSPVRKDDVTKTPQPSPAQKTFLHPGKVLGSRSVRRQPTFLVPEMNSQLEDRSTSTIASTALPTVSRNTRSNNSKFLSLNRMPPPSVPLLPFGAEELIPATNQRLFYSDVKDVPKRTAEEFTNYHAPTPTHLLDSLPAALTESGYSVSSKRTRWLEPARAAPLPPPKPMLTPSVIKESLFKTPALPSRSVTTSSASSPFKVNTTSQLSQFSSLSHATPGNPVTGNQKKTSLRTALEKNPENNHLTLFGFEVFARNRSTASGREGKGKPFALLPDPQFDPVIGIFYCVRDDQRDELLGTGRGSTDEFGFMFWSEAIGDKERGDVPSWFGPPNRKDHQQRVDEFKDETSMFQFFIELVREIDPDVLMGWEVQKDSLGYLLQRAKTLGLTTFPRDLSRVPYGQQDRRHENDEWGNAEHSGFWIPGRHIFNLWRICREELKLTSYTEHNVLTQLTGEKLPKYSPAVLWHWWENETTKFLVVKHFKQRVMTLLKICDHLDVLGRNSELARLFGMDLFSVMTRGSQFRVEAVLLRICKGLGYLMLSPTRKQVASQPAMDATPLIFEPKSAFYASPVLVLDFRSLYPSVVIANNICFSTCLGKLKPNAEGPSSAPSAPNSSSASPVMSGGEDSETESTAFISGLGVDAGYYPPLPTLSKKEDYGFVSPNGVCFVSRKKREGVLPRMLREILDTRVMIKSSVEGPDVEESKRRVADARQFGLKMIANVTYGYTAASFSGRMPCAEIADAIVQTGRACLELAVKVVHDPTAPWAPAECVYGDTDSLFVHLPGRNLEEARRLGRLISDKVSQSLPKPMKLQFEKVFFPCVLEVKKRYVGWKFPSKAPSRGGEEKGTLDAKGIETIRRDGCPAVVKTLEATLKEIFTSRDLSKVKAHLRKEFDKMFAGTVSLSDFIITGKVKLGSYAKDRKNKGNYPPAAVVADKMMKRDPRAKPLYKERVAYVVACGPPGSRLIDLVVNPHELMLKSLRVNVAHYIDKLILPALERLLGCAAVDVKSWFHFEKSKNLWGGWRRRLNVTSASTNQIHRFFEYLPCVLCAKPSHSYQPLSSLFASSTSSSTTTTAAGNMVLCTECASDLQRARFAADVISMVAENRARSVLRTCGRCVQGGAERNSIGCPSSIAAGVAEMCLNLDCEDFFVRRRAMDRVVFDVDTLNKVGSGGR